jgi:dTDP-glucose 4,6-dehydratase
LEQDVRNLHDIPTNVQWVIHAAGSPDSKEHVSQPLRTIETIYKGTQSILDVCFRLPDLQKLLHISSHTVYGNTDALTLIPETAMGALACNSVNSAYPEAKRMAETLCAIYRNQQRLPITVVRPFAFVGPYHGLDKPWAINNFIRDGLLGGPIRILGNGKTVRSYLYGSDAAYWLVVLLAKGKEGQTYNMGSSEGINLNALAEKIAGIIGNNTHILTKSAKENYTNFSSAVPDTTKVLQQFGLSEKFQLEEALIRTIGWNQLKK